MNSQCPKVLIVDDEPSNLYLMVRVLEDNGYKTTTCKDSREALDCFDRLHPDIVLLDLYMPHQGGQDLCQQIRAKNADTPIIMVSCETDPQIKAKLLDCGADDFICKPISISETQSRIQSILSKRKKLQMLNDDINNIKTFSKALSHDLSNYMNTIYGFSSLLKDDMPAVLKHSDADTHDSVMDSVMTIYNFSNECSNVIESLLMLALCEDGELRANYGKISLAIESSIEEQMKIFNINEDQINCECAPNTDIIGDANWLKIVFNNLLSNAIKYADPENLKVSIRFEESESEVSCIIADNGKGVDQKTLDTLLTKTTSCTQPPHPNGHGYGLQIANAIVQKVGGSIKYHYDKGSQFTVTLLKWNIPDIKN